MLGRENSILQRPSPLRHILPVRVTNPLPSSFPWARRTHFHAGSSLEPLIGSNLTTVRSSQGKNLEALFASRRGGGETYPPRWSCPLLPRSYPLAGPGNTPHRGGSSIQQKESSGHRKSLFSSEPGVAIQAEYLHEIFERVVATVGQFT